MARPVAKARPPKHLVALAVVAVLGLVVVADYLWASSSSGSPSAVWSSRINLPTGPTAQAPPVVKEVTPSPSISRPLLRDARLLSLLRFKRYVLRVGFYLQLYFVYSRLVGEMVSLKTSPFYNFPVQNTKDKKPVGSMDINATFADLPAPELKWEEMAEAPVVRLDGAAIQIKNLLYVFAGYGTINHVMVLQEGEQYAPATQLWRGRLHVMGGSKEDRHEPGLEHWSLAVKDGKALEKEWRSEIPIPRGGPHRACVVANDKLLVIGGQEGDFMAKPGSPIFKCVRRSEVVYSNVYMLDDGMTWKELPPMPKPDSHIEFAWVNVNNSLIIAGGTTDKHPITKKMVLVGEVFRFNLDTLEWSVLGRLPFRIKTTLVGYWDGWLYFTSGQRDKGPKDPSPKKVVGCMFRTKLHL
nr:unnamed protein product [Digitaria exilis]